jgi:hypothetical protein
LKLKTVFGLRILSSRDGMALVSDRAREYPVSRAELEREMPEPEERDIPRLYDSWLSSQIMRSSGC